MRSRLFRRKISLLPSPERTLSGVDVGVGAACLAISVLTGLSLMRNAVVIDGIALFGIALGSFLMLVFPLFPALMSVAHVDPFIRNRFASLLWNRQRYRYLLGRVALRILLKNLTVFFCFSFLLFCFALFLWPALQPGMLDPEGYGLITAEDLRNEQVSRFTTSEWIGLGELTFGLLFCLLFAGQLAAYGLIGAGVFILTGRALVGVSAPLALYWLETLVVVPLGLTHFGLWYTLVPFGLAQGPVWTLLSMVIAIWALALGIWSRILVHPRSVASLT